MYCTYCGTKPETGINQTSKAQYAANILHCTRQLHYSLASENSIDIVLFVNGIPVVSMELKDQFTGQNTTNAIAQYRFDRAGKDEQNEGFFVRLFQEPEMMNDVMSGIGESLYERLRKSVGYRYLSGETEDLMAAEGQAVYHESHA